MNKRRRSKLGIVVNILIIILILTLIGSGFLLYFNLNKDIGLGSIKLPNLTIKFETSTSGKSEIAFNNTTNVMPGESLNNESNLSVTMRSLNSTYLIVLYALEAQKNLDGQVIEDSYDKPILDIGYNYINSLNSTYEKNSMNSDKWIDYVCSLDEKVGDTIVTNKYRCLVSPLTWGNEDSPICVIKSGEFKLHAVGIDDKYQDSTLKFSFQAYGISENDENLAGVNFSHLTEEEKCAKIVKAIHKSFGEKFDFYQDSTIT